MLIFMKTIGILKILLLFFVVFEKYLLYIIYFLSILEKKLKYGIIIIIVIGPIENYLEYSFSGDFICFKKQKEVIRRWKGLNSQLNKLANLFC